VVKVPMVLATSSIHLLLHREPCAIPINFRKRDDRAFLRDYCLLTALEGLKQWRIAREIRQANLGHDGDCFPTLCGWRTVPMKTRRPLNYLRSYRLRWGLSQGELANLLGCKTAGVISRIEKKLRSPTLKIVIGCLVLFGTPAAEVFPDISGTVEADVMEKVWELYEKMQGDPSRKTKKKIELLESVIERVERRMHKPRI
jgi:transcriptional regulator with XRE-family HTH domain